MNKTKYSELKEALKARVPDIHIRYKNLFDQEEPAVYWRIEADEYFYHLDMASIEWFEIAAEIKNVEVFGRLIKPKISVCDKSKEL